MIDWDALVLAPLLGVFGEAVRPTYTPYAGAAPQAAFQVDGVFDRAFKEVVIFEDRAPQNTVAPVLGVRVAQFAVAPSQNDRVFIPSIGLNYVVNNVEIDGHGWALLRLNRVLP